MPPSQPSQGHAAARCALRIVPATAGKEKKKKNRDEFQRKLLTGSFFGGAQVHRVVSSAHGDAVDRGAAVSQDTQAGGFAAVPEPGRAVSGAGEDVSSSVHNGSVQNTCRRAESTFRDSTEGKNISRNTSILKALDCEPQGAVPSVPAADQGTEAARRQIVGGEMWGTEPQLPGFYLQNHPLTSRAVRFGQEGGNFGRVWASDAAPPAPRDLLMKRSSL